MAVRTIITLGEQQLAFEDHNELLNWLSGERAKWSWLGDVRISANAWNGAVANYNDLTNEINRNAQMNQPLSVMTGLIVERFSGALVYSESVEGERILKIANSEGHEAGGAAYAFYRNQVTLGDIRSIAALRGVMAFAFPAHAPIDQVLVDLAAERNQLRRTARDVQSRSEENEKERDRNVRVAHRRAARRFLSAMRGILDREAKADDLRQASLLSFDEEGRKSIERFDAVEASYREKIGLLAPVEYWKNKSNRHRRSRGWLLSLTIMYFIATIFGLGYVFFKSGIYLIHEKLENGSALFVVGAGLATLSGVLLWAGRLITRLYLSEHHLAHDAEERAVMTETYLALTGEKAATDAERAIILTALFRNTSDGVVKDDSAPDVSMGGLIARLVGGKGP